LRRQGEAYKAEEILRHVLPKQVDLLGGGHRHVQRSIEGLILILDMTDRKVEADRWREKKLAAQNNPAGILT
jgi:hypothetical protein